jgi:hypothetical protein
VSDKVSQLLDVIKRQNAGLEALIAERDKLRAELDAFVNWANGDMNALGYLQRTYNDPSESTANRTKCAIGALKVEHPSVVIQMEDWAAKTKRIRLAAMERDRARWALEDQSKTIEGTLASDHAGDPICPEDSPAA